MADIRYWGGVERSGDRPLVLVYDDGSTNGGKPVWRRKMTAEAVIAAHEQGKMSPLNSCPYSRNSRCASVEDLHAIVAGQPVSIAKGTRGARGTKGTCSMNVAFPWDEDTEEITKSAPKDHTVEWSDSGDFVAATFGTVFQSEEFVVWFDRSGVFSVKGSDGSETNPRVFGMDEKAFVMFCEWISFHRNKTSFKEFRRNVRGHYRFTSV